MHSKEIWVPWTRFLMVALLVASNARSEDVSETAAIRQPREPVRIEVIKETQNP